MEGLGEILEVEVLVDGLDAILGTELKHVINVLDGTNKGASHGDLIVHQILVVNRIGEGSVGSAHHYVDSSLFQQPLVKFVKFSVLDEESRDHYVIFSCILAKFFRVSGMLNIRGAELPERLGVLYPSCEGSDLHSKFVGILN